MPRSITIDSSAEVMAGENYVHEGGENPFRRRGNSPKYMSMLNEAYTLFGRAMDGNPYAMLDLREAFSTSDFPLLFGDILSRELLPQYQVAPAMWPQFARRTVVRDFRPHKLIDLLGGQGILDEVPELTEYQAKRLQEEEYRLRVKKHGNRFALSWEAFVNDDLDGLRELPNRLAVSARRSEDHHATSQVTSETGPVALDYWGTHNVGDANEYSNLYLAANSQSDEDHPQLTVDSLSEGISVIGNRRDVDDAPLIVDGFILMVPPALEVVANTILNAREIRLNDGQGQELIVGNWLSGRVTPVVNPWLPVVDKSANVNSTWYLLPVPASPRPGIVLGFLRGYETPDLRLRSSDSERVGGGSVPGEEGSFDNDDVQYRVRHVYGGTQVDPFASLVSLGTGDFSTVA